jgi:hypothetical protein
MDVARESIELGDDQGRMAQPACGECRGDLRPVVLLAGFDFLEFTDDEAFGAGDMQGTASRCASRPRPEAPSCFIETR